MDSDPPVAAPGHDREKAAWKATAHGESSAVVDPDGSFRGLVPPVRFLAVLRAEHDEDLARLGGYLTSSASARHAMYEPIATHLWHRLPWLVLGLISSAGAARLVNSFAETLASDVRLAFFIPGIVYMADALQPTLQPQHDDGEAEVQRHPPNPAGGRHEAVPGPADLRVPDRSSIRRLGAAEAPDRLRCLARLLRTSAAPLRVLGRAHVRG